MKSIANKISELRIKKGFTQDTLGEKIGVSRSQVSLYEKGKNKPNVEMLEKIAKATGVQLNYFFDAAPPKEEGFLERKLTELQSEYNELMKKYISLLEQNQIKK